MRRTPGEIPRKRGRKPRGPIPTPVVEEDIIEPPKLLFWKETWDVLWIYRKPAGIFIGTALLVFWLVPAAWQAGMERLGRWQAGRLVERGAEYARQGDANAARMSADTALRLDPANAGALRLLGQVLTAEGRSQDAFEVYRRLGETGQATLPEFKGFAVMASRAGYSSMAEWIANWVVLRGEPDFPHIMRADSLGAQGRNAEALGELRRALEVSNSDRARRELARFLLATSDLGESNAEVYSLLKGIVDDDGEGGREALMVGILSGVVPPAGRGGWLRRMRSHPLADGQALAIADAVEVAANPDSKPAIVEALLKRVLPASIEERMLAGRWLVRHGEAGRVGEILPLGQAVARPDAFALWLEAKAAAGAWQAIVDALGRGNAGLPADTVRLALGQALKKTGRVREGRAQYSLVVQEAKADPSRLVPALAFLQADGEEAMFRENALTLLANGKMAADVLPVLAGAVRQRGDARALREFLRLAVQAGPLADYPPLLDECDYLDLVLGNPVDHGAVAARASNFPGVPAFRFTEALSQWRRGQAALALQTAESTGLRVRDLEPRHQLVAACTLASTGDMEKARKVAALLEVSPLTAQERAMLQNFLQQM